MAETDPQQVAQAFEIDILKRQGANKDRQIKFLDATYQAGLVKNRLERLKNENDTQNAVDQREIRSSLGGMIASGNQQPQQAPIAGQLKPVGPAKHEGRTGSTGTAIDEVFNAIQGVVSTTTEGDPVPTGRQGESTSTSTTTSSGGLGLKGTAGALAARGVGNLLDALIPGDQSKSLSLLKNAGIRTSTNSVTSLTPEFKKSREEAMQVIGVGAANVLEGDTTAQEHKVLVKSQMSKFREPSDQKMILEGAQRAAEGARQNRQLLRAETMEKQVTALAGEGITVGPGITKGLSSINRTTRLQAQEAVGHAMRSSPKIQQQWVNLDAAEINLERAEVAAKSESLTYEERLKGLAKSDAERATVAAGIKLKGELATANIPIPPQKYEPAAEGQAMEKLVADAFGGFDIASEVDPGGVTAGRLGSILESSHKPKEGFFGASRKTYNDASILLDLRNETRFRFLQLQELRSGNPHTLYMDGDKMKLGRIDSARVQQSIDILNGNKPLNENGEFIETIADGTFNAEKTRKAQQEAADYLQSGVQGGLGITATENKVGDWSVTIGDNSLNPQAANAYLTIGTHRLAAEQVDGSRIFGPAR